MLKIKLTKSQWERISDILGSLSLVSVASVVIPYVLDKPNLFLAFFGIVITIILWYASVVVARKY